MKKIIVITLVYLLIFSSIIPEVLANETKNLTEQETNTQLNKQDKSIFSITPESVEEIKNLKKLEGLQKNTLSI